MSDASDDQDPEDGATALTILWDTVKSATEWKAVKDAMTEFSKDPDWAAAGEEGQNALRSEVWTAVASKVKAGEMKIDFITDATAFRMWIETQVGPDGADAIEGNFRAFKREPAFENLKDDRKAQFRAVIERKMAALRGQ